jgi:NADH:ubiquinone oxidoreductase subunit E
MPLALKNLSSSMWCFLLKNGVYHQAIETILRDRGLHEWVDLQASGCLGKCSMAPNIVLMPGKKRLSGMNPEAIADLLTTFNN